MSIKTICQVKTFGPRTYTVGSDTYALTVKVRHDDRCRNGHNTFSITGTLTRNGNIEKCGCLHEDIKKHFPELEPYIKYHLCSTDGPMGYIHNTVYLSGDRDCWGLRSGETRQIRDGRTGEPAWRLCTINIYTQAEEEALPRTQDGVTQPPLCHRLEWRPWLKIGSGKERELDAARVAAIWPDATDEELTAPGLEDRLQARLPKLMEEFRLAVESLGLVY